MTAVRTKNAQRAKFEWMASELARQMGGRIAARRREVGMTQDAVAREMATTITGTTVSKWERGEHRPTDANLQRLAEILGVEPSYFMVDAPTGAVPDLMDAMKSEPAALRQIQATLDEIVERLTRLESAAALQRGGRTPREEDDPPRAA